MTSARRRRPRPYATLGPRTWVARHTHYDRIVWAAGALRSAEDHLTHVVQTAYDAGDSWSTIGAALGISRQAAQQRFRRRPEEPSGASDSGDTR